MEHSAVWFSFLGIPIGSPVSPHVDIVHTIAFVGTVVAAIWSYSKGRGRQFRNDLLIEKQRLFSRYMDEIAELHHDFNWVVYHINEFDQNPNNTESRKTQIEEQIYKHARAVERLYDTAFLKFNALGFKDEAELVQKIKDAAGELFDGRIGPQSIEAAAKYRLALTSTINAMGSAFRELAESSGKK